ncbi:hypothetical protein GGS26DRAFT_329310 [Hypomontagnella submonticulosa]|nr:hypothetical protein GGS26DRAFT_329310 [Hypomontagnella submonticulosa]
MKKFGFGRKNGDGDDDANRSALFGKKGSPAPSSDNPYAQSQLANDPYMEDNNKYANMTPNMTPYQQARARLPDRSGGLPSGPSPQNRHGAPPPSRNDSNYSSNSTLPPYPGTQQAPAGGYANDRYGTSSGYGASKYNNSNGYGSASISGPTRPGGYGGLGRSNSNDTDANRDALFSGVRERHDQQQSHNQNGNGIGVGAEAGAYGSSGADSDNNKYGGYGEQRELTAQEQDDADADAHKDAIRQEKMATLQTTENISRIVDQTLSVAYQTTARLGAQAERLNYTESLVDRGSMASREAEEQTKKLKSLNRNMFAVHVGNPFTAKKRNAEAEQKALEQHRADRELRETTRKEGYMANQRMETHFREVERAGARDNVWKKQSAAEKSKYQFEADSDDERMEDGINNNMDKAAQGISTLNGLAYVMKDEVESQNKMIDRIGTKSDQLSDATAVHTRRLKTIK